MDNGWRPVPNHPVGTTIGGPIKKWLFTAKWEAIASGRAAWISRGNVQQQSACLRPLQGLECSKGGELKPSLPPLWALEKKQCLGALAGGWVRI